MQLFESAKIIVGDYPDYLKIQGNHLQTNSSVILKIIFTGLRKYYFETAFFLM
jgi:hypothetical protein